MPDIDARNSLPTTLRDHLSWQMQMTPFSEIDKPIAQALIDAINDEGYLTCSLDDVQQALIERTSELGGISMMQIAMIAIVALFAPGSLDEPEKFAATRIATQPAALRIPPTALFISIT